MKFCKHTAAPPAAVFLVFYPRIKSKCFLLTCHTLYLYLYLALYLYCFEDVGIPYKKSTLPQKAARHVLIVSDRAKDSRCAAADAGDDAPIDNSPDDTLWRR